MSHHSCRPLKLSPLPVQYKKKLQMPTEIALLKKNCTTPSVRSVLFTSLCEGTAPAAKRLACLSVELRLASFKIILSLLTPDLIIEDGVDDKKRLFITQLL